MTDDLIDRCWAPKAYGGWNLHQALNEGEAEQPLDWFCSFSAAAALVGSPGQGAYAAANSWLNAFAHWRRAQGLPSTAIAWGAWAEVGRAAALAEDDVRADRARRGLSGVPGVTALPPPVLLLRADQGDAMAGRLRATQPVRRSVPVQGEWPSGQGQIPGRTEIGTARRMAWDDSAADLRPDQLAVAALDRPGSTAARITVWIRWAIWNCAPGSKPKPAYGSVPPRSPRFEAWQTISATSWKLRKLRWRPADAKRGENVAGRAVNSRNPVRLGTQPG